VFREWLKDTEGGLYLFLKCHTDGSSDLSIENIVAQRRDFSQ